MDTGKLDELARKLIDALPGSVRELRADVEKNFRSALQSGFTKMDLVTREEFDVQTEVLARTRAKVENLEKQLAALEAALAAKD